MPAAGGSAVNIVSSEAKGLGGTGKYYSEGAPGQDSLYNLW